MLLEPLAGYAVITKTMEVSELPSDTSRGLGARRWGAWDQAALLPRPGWHTGAQAAPPAIVSDLYLALSHWMTKFSTQFPPLRRSSGTGPFPVSLGAKQCCSQKALSKNGMTGRVGSPAEGQRRRRSPGIPSLSASRDLEVFRGTKEWTLKIETDVRLVPGPQAFLAPSYHPGLPSRTGGSQAPGGTVPLPGDFAGPLLPALDPCSGPALRA